jgi:hypothetical protein
MRELRKVSGEEVQLFIRICFKGVDELRSVLKMDEYGFRLVCGSGHFSTRDYYIYGVLDEIEKAGVAILQFQEILSDGQGPDASNRLTRNILSSTLDEGWLWIRKLTELLIEAKCFFATNQNEYYKHYLLIRELEAYRKLNIDFKEFFACNNENIGCSIERLENEIKRLESKLDLSKCWYLKSRKPNTRREFSDVKTRLKFALHNFNKLERLMVGLSYEGCYTRPSRSIHVSIGGPHYDCSMKDVKTIICHIGLVAAQTLFSCRKLLKVRSKNFLKQLEPAFKANQMVNQIFESATKPKIARGDIVIAYGDLAEVTGTAKSNFGYRSFKVKYLSRPPLPQIPEEMFPARYVKLFVKRKEMARLVKAEMKRIAPDTSILSNKRFSAALHQTVVDLWDNLGLKEYVYGRPDLMKKKIEIFLKKDKIGA